MEFTPMIILAQKGSKIYPNTNLPITLWLKYDKKKIIYMQNNYNKYTTGNDLIPISIDKENPQLVYDVKLGIPKEEFKRVQDFIKRHYDFLKEYTERDDMDIGDIHGYLSSWETEPWLIDSINGYSIYLYVGDYENYPHFHFVDEETKGKKFNSSIKIDRAEYLNHSLNKNNKLNKKQKEDLQKLLERPFRSKKIDGTNYEFIKDMWNMNYDNKVDENLTMPNYMELK